jgi:hypothetical protein
MQTSRDPMAPLRTWKELFLGERAAKNKRSSRPRRRYSHHGFTVNAHPATTGE